MDAAACLGEVRHRPSQQPSNSVVANGRQIKRLTVVVLLLTAVITFTDSNVPVIYLF